MKTFIYIIFFTLISINCFSQNIDISGFVNDNINKIYLQKQDGISEPDSCIISQDKKFKFSVNCNKYEYFRLYSNWQKSLLLIVSQDDNIVINFDNTNPQNSIVKGSPKTEYYIKINKTISDLYSKYSTNTNEFHQHLNKSLSKIIKKNASQPANLLLTTILDINSDFQLFELIAQNADTNTNPMAKDLQNRVISYKKTLLNQPFPEIKAPDTLGNIISTKSINKDTNLVIFWAGCNQESVKYMLKIKEKYNNNSNIDIYAYSFDGNRDIWQKAIKQIDIKAIHVSNLKYFDTPEAKLFYITSLPVIFWIDKDGKILKKEKF
ncbi:MAG: thioredoxin family protein [Bacteroidales bacterium]|nr:thioredoxin family protein [Bacteroidales bacterium]